MNLVDAIELLKKYAVCPKCGSDMVGGDSGTWECDTSAGYFKRTCRCGWGVEVMEDIDGKQKEIDICRRSAADDRKQQGR